MAQLQDLDPTTLLLAFAVSVNNNQRSKNARPIAPRWEVTYRRSKCHCHCHCHCRKTQARPIGFIGQFLGDYFRWQPGGGHEGAWRLSTIGAARALADAFSNFCTRSRLALSWGHSSTQVSIFTHLPWAPDPSSSAISPSRQWSLCIRP